MRGVLENVLKSKDPLSNPETQEKYENDMKRSESKLKNVKKENQELAEIIKSKEKELESQVEILKEKDARIERLKIAAKESKSF